MTIRITWPCDRFFWATIEAPGVRRAGELPAGLLPLLEEDVPLEMPELHAVCVPFAGGRLAVCALERTSLASLAHEARVLTPDSLPPFLRSLSLSPTDFNVLCGPFEPRVFTFRRIRHHALLAAAILLSGAMLALGLHRRTTHWDLRADTARAAAADIASRVIPSGDPSDLANEVAQLRLTHDALAQVRPAPDAALALAAVLHAWPTSVPGKPHSISIGSSGISISTSIEGDAAAFLSAFSPPPGWRLDEPRLNAADNITRLSLHLRPEGATQ